MYYDYNLYETGPKVKFIEQKYHTLFFKTIDSTIDEIEFRYQDTTLLPIVQMAKAIRNADAECVYELKKLQVYNEIVDFNKLQNEIALWRHIRNQSSFNECCWNLRLENFIRKNEVILIKNFLFYFFIKVNFNNFSQDQKFQPFCQKKKGLYFQKIFILLTRFTKHLTTYSWLKLYHN